MQYTNMKGYQEKIKVVFVLFWETGYTSDELMSTTVVTQGSEPYFRHLISLT